MKRFLTLILCLGILSASVAQNTDGGATAIMQKLATKYKGFTTMKINYTYKAEKEKKTLDAFQGVAYIKGNKYYITFDNQKQFFYCDGVSMWNYQKASNEVSVYDYEESDDDALNPAKLVANWQKQYNAKLIRDGVENNKAVQVIDLTPKVSHSYYKIRLTLDKGKNEIIRTSIYEKDNTIYTYIFTTFTTNQTIDDSTFKFNASKFPGVEVNDMR